MTDSDKIVGLYGIVYNWDHNRGRGLLGADRVLVATFDSEEDAIRYAIGGGFMDWEVKPCQKIIHNPKE